MARPPARHTPYEHEGRCSNGCRSVNKGYWNGGSGTSANHSEAEEKGAFDSELAERTAAPNGDYLAIFQIAKISRHRQAFPTTPGPWSPSRCVLRSPGWQPLIEIDRSAAWSVHPIPNPSCAPAWLRVPIPDGSSSDAPVSGPGPKAARKFRTRNVGRS